MLRFLGGHIGIPTAVTVKMRSTVVDLFACVRSVIRAHSLATCDTKIDTNDDERRLQFDFVRSARRAVWLHA